MPGSLTFRKSWRLLLGFGIFAALVMLLTRNGGQLSAALHVLRSATLTALLVAIAAFVASFCVAAYIYVQLAFKRLRFGDTTLVEVASAGVNRLVPSGLGALSLHGLYLYRRRHSVAEATAIVSINNLIGITAHLSLLAVVVLLGRGKIVPARFHIPPQVALFGGVGLVVVIILLAFSAPLRRRVTSFIRNLGVSLRRYAKHPGKLLRAYGGALCLTLVYVLMFAMCAHAVHAPLSAQAAFMAFTIGTLTGTAVPTPGGLAGAEAGFFAGLVAYGVSVPAATAAVILYRLLTYWLPLPLGFIALAVARRKKLV